ncbi:MAG: acetyl-CoA hydrolase [Verrucomicrobiota bacterium]|nr:MAG: acetyl-CoA hydrolase [Verrucomicrobiota bacterium]
MQKLTPEEAVALIQPGDTIGIGGFTSAGAPSTLGSALLVYAQQCQKNGTPLALNIITGASTLSSIDDGLAACDGIRSRVPYQADRLLRQKINDESVRFWDYHLSDFPQKLCSGILGAIDYTLIEAESVDDQGRIILTSAVGIAPTLCRLAKKIIVELRKDLAIQFQGIHDIYEMELPPCTLPIPLTQVTQRIGTGYVQVDPHKIAGVIQSNSPREHAILDHPTPESNRIGEHILRFLEIETHLGRLPKALFPLQVGVGNVANALMQRLTEVDGPSYEVYSEVLQDAIIEGVLSGRIRMASGGAFAVTESCFQTMRTHWEVLRAKTLLRPQEITNHPEIIRRLGIISINTALEVDLWGNVNSTHVCGRQMMNGIGGSGDFARNAYLTIFATPSTAKNGAIGAIVPLCSHIDHIDHDVDIVVTEYGLADLRGKTPRERAVCIIENCAHPNYREALQACITSSRAHVPIDLSQAHRFHLNFLEQGKML